MNTSNMRQASSQSRPKKQRKRGARNWPPGLNRLQITFGGPLWQVKGTQSCWKKSGSAFCTTWLTRTAGTRPSCTTVVCYCMPKNKVAERRCTCTWSFEIGCYGKEATQRPGTAHQVHPHGSLEVYHSLLYNKYMPKRQHLGYKRMVRHSQSAALDHNSGIGQEQTVSSSGERRYRYIYPKGMKDWVVKPVLEKKTKLHVAEMLHAVLEIRAMGKKPGQLEVPWLPKNIAPVTGPPKEQLLARHASRFSCCYSRFIHCTFTLCLNSRVSPKNPFYFWFCLDMSQFTGCLEEDEYVHSWRYYPGHESFPSASLKPV